VVRVDAEVVVLDSLADIKHAQLFDFVEVFFVLAQPYFLLCD